MSKDKVWVGFDLGGTKMLAKIFDDNYQTLGKAKLKTEGYRGSEAGLERMEQVINDALESAGATAEQVQVIGVGCPGPINPNKGKIVEAPNLGWSNVPVAKKLGKAFDCDVAVCNDVDAGVYGEFHLGAAKGAHSAVGIFPGTGIGAGAVIGGQMVQGGNLSCMELGHIPLFPETSGSGEHGTTLELECSRLKIASEAARAAYRGQAPHLLELCGTDLSKITSGKLAKSIKAGDKAIEEIVERSATLLGCGVATVVHLLAPDIFVLGGGLVEALPELYLGTVEKSARSRVLETYKDSFKIVTAELGDDAGVIGAAAWARNRFGV
ncbi:MAG: ROK family protein [Verrucomicrobiota bacterium]